jgi:hypothetical protein
VGYTEPRDGYSGVPDTGDVRTDPYGLASDSDETLRERWIPNTGEYLVLRTMAVAGTGKNGARVLAGLRGMDVFVEGAIDRSQTDEPTDGVEHGNIYTNTAEYFELALLNPGRVRTGLLGWLQRRAGSMEYEFVMSFPGADGVGADDSDFYNADGSLKAGNSMRVSQKGNVVEIEAFGEKGASIGIRPVSSVQAYPGDDLILQFGLRNRKTGIVANIGRVRDEDYVAVYDKKMLWRANLYIDEGLDDDWNNVHPWNAPPGIASGGSQGVTYAEPVGWIPAWWSYDWGFNEWNRVHDGTASAATIAPINGLSTLTAGDGKQGIKFIPFTPPRTLKISTSEPSSENSITGTVAYSYPSHAHEPTEGNKGYAGSMDSPFDYNKKMQLQLSLLGEWYNGAGKRFEKPREAWPNPGALVASAFPSWDSYKEHVTGQENQRENVSEATFNALNTDSTNWSTQAELTNALTRWVKATPPEDRWWRYVVEEPSEDWTSASDTYTKAFVPGLGLRIFYQTPSLFEQPGDIIVDSFTNRAYVIEAGTDCLGFAQRAASWDGNINDWVDLPHGWAETDYGNIWQVLNSYGTLHRHYPSDASDIAINAIYSPLEGYSIISKGIEKDEPTNAVHLAALRRVVIGDIWVKDTSSDADTTGDAQRDHIAIVAYVPPNAYELDAATLMSQIILIEGEFTNKIQSVIKKLSVGDYNASNLLSSRSFYNDSVVFPKSGLELNCQSWAIRRLK